MSLDEHVNAERKVTADAWTELRQIILRCENRQTGDLERSVVLRSLLRERLGLRIEDQDSMENAVRDVAAIKMRQRTAEDREAAKQGYPERESAARNELLEIVGCTNGKMFFGDSAKLKADIYKAAGAIGRGDICLRIDQIRSPAAEMQAIFDGDRMVIGELNKAQARLSAMLPEKLPEPNARPVDRVIERQLVHPDPNAVAAPQGEPMIVTGLTAEMVGA